MKLVFSIIFNAFFCVFSYIYMRLTDIFNWFNLNRLNVFYFDLNGVFIGFVCGFNVMFN